MVPCALTIYPQFVKRFMCACPSLSVSTVILLPVGPSFLCLCHQAIHHKEIHCCSCINPFTGTRLVPFLCLVCLPSLLLPSLITPDTLSSHNLSAITLLHATTMTENGTLYAFQCPLDNCSRWFKNLTGLTQHIRAKHPNEDVNMNIGMQLD